MSAKTMFKTGETIRTKADLTDFFEAVIGHTERQLGDRKAICHAFMTALNRFQKLRDEAPGIVHYTDEQLKGFSREGLIEAVETLTEQGLAVLDRLNSLEQDSETEAKVYLERQDLKLRTKKRVKIISAGRVTLSKQLLEELDCQVGDVVDVYRYSVDGEFPKLLVEFVTWGRERKTGEKHPENCCCGSCSETV